MADLKISELAALAGANLAAGDLLPIVDLSASETKKITVTDLVGNATTLIADATIPGAKILFGSSQVPGAALVDSGVTTAKLASKAVSAAKLGDESTVDLVTTLPASGAFVGQLALDTDDLKVYCWNGSSWQSIKAAGSINTITGSGGGIVNVTVTTTGDSVSIATTLDTTTNAGEFLAGPTSGGGAVGYRAIAGTDLPAATTSAKGGVIVNGNGLTMSGSTIALDNTVTANTSAYHVIQYTSKGLVSGGRAITGSDLPLATGGSVGAMRPDTDLSVSVAGVLSHANSIAPGTATKVTYDGRGHITSGAALIATDIPDLSAAKITSGTLASTLIGNNSIAGAKLANASTVKFGGAGSTAGIVTFPTPDFQGQYFFDALNGDLYLYDGAAWQPITITSGELIYAGTYNAITNQVKSLTAAGTAAGLVVGSALPAASNGNLRYYLVVADSGNGISPAPAVALAPPDMIVSNGATWDLIDVSNAIAGQTATNISFTPYGNLAATNVQTALQELDDEKLAKSGGTITGNLEIGTAGSLTWEGSTADTYETTLTVVDPTLDRTITLPDASGTVVLSGAIVNADISASAAIADTKLATISTAGKVSNSATTATSSNTASAIVARDASGNFTAGTITATGFSGSGASLTSLTAGNLSGTIPSGVLGNSSLFVGTTSIALNRASANLALTGISSVAMPGATSGSITMSPAAVAGTTTITLPATTGTVITSGDNSTVTNTMVASGIAGSKITPDFGSQTVTTTGVFSAALGTAAAPSLTFTGDLNTGVYSPGADQVAISTGGTGRVFVASDGKVGVAKTPGVAFDVEGPVRSTQGTIDVRLQAGAGGAAAVGTYSTDPLLVVVSGTERARFDSSGNMALGSTTAAGYAFLIGKALTGATSTYGVVHQGVIQSDSTSNAAYFTTAASTQAAAFTVGNIYHYQALQGTIGAGSAVTNQIGFAVNANLTGATNNYGFFSNIPAGTGRWNFYAANTANNYFAGNVGIGTTNPVNPLDVQKNQNAVTVLTVTNTDTGASAASGVQFVCGTKGINFLVNGAGSYSGLSGIGGTTTNYYDFDTHIWRSIAGTERARIDSSGRLLVGTSSARANAFAGGVAPQVQMEGTTGPTSSLLLASNRNDTGQAFLVFGKSRSTSVSGNTSVASGDILGTITFQGADGTNLIEGARIESYVDGTPGTNDMPGRLVFSTTADGASSPTERLRIASTGRVTVTNSSLGTPSALGNTSGTITLDLATANHFSLTLNANATNTLANPSNQTAGQSGSIVITQDATGSRTLAYGTNWKFPGGTAPTLTTTANAVDVLVYYVESATRITARLISDVK